VRYIGVFFNILTHIVGSILM